MLALEPLRVACITRKKLAVETTAVVNLSAGIGGNIPRRTGASPCLLRLQGGDSKGAEPPLTSAAAHKRLCRYGFFPEPEWDRPPAPQPPGPIEVQIPCLGFPWAIPAIVGAPLA